jgi:predicted TPR repeat methyltransferase
VDAWRDLAAVRDGLGDTRGALEAYARALELLPVLEHELERLAELSEALGDSTRAAQARARLMALRSGT